MSRVVVTSLVAGVLGFVPLATSARAAVTPDAPPGPGPVARPVPAIALPDHGLGAGVVPPVVPKAVPAAGPAVASAARSQVLGPARTLAVAGVDATVALAGATAARAVLDLQPGYLFGDTSLALSFTADVAGPATTDWTAWFATVTDVATGVRQPSATFPRAPRDCIADYEVCVSLGTANGWQLQDGATYTVTVSVRRPDGTVVESLPSLPAVARLTVDPPALPNTQASGCACPNVLTRQPGLQALRGDLVNTATGALVRTEPDLAMASFGIPFQAVRMYSSTNVSAGLLGTGWTWTYDVRVIAAVAGGPVRVRAEDGTEALFQPAAGGGFTRPPGVQSNLAVGPGGAGWLLTTADQRRLTFDAAGRLTKVANARGHGVTLAYSATGTLVSLTDAAGRVVRATTDAATGVVTRLDLPDARSVAYTYANGRLATVRDARGLVWTYGYDTVGRLVTVTDPAGQRVTTVVYGADGRVSTQTDAAGAVTTFGWNATTQEAATRDADGVEFRDGYRGNVLVYVRNARGETVNLRYDARLHRTLAVDAKGNQTQVTHDTDGNVTDTRAPEPFGYTEANTFDANNNLRIHKDSRSNLWSFGFNATNEQTSQKDPTQTDGYRYTYDSRGLVLTRTDPRNKVTLYEYDAAGNRTAVVTPTGRRTEVGYDGTGRVVSVTDPRGTAAGASAATRAAFTTTIGYDAEDRVVSRKEPNKKYPMVTAYDAFGAVVKVTDPLLRAVTYARDKVGRVTRVTDPKGRSTTYTYTAAGRMLSVTDAKGFRTSWTYETGPGRRGRVETETSPRGNQLADAGAPDAQVALFRTTFHYDPAGNVVQTERPDPNGGPNPVKVDTRFDELNRPVAQVDEFGRTTRASFDENGNVTQLFDENGKSLTYGYDAANRRKGGTTAGGGSPATIEYDEVGSPVSQTSPTGGTTTWQYDDDGRTVAVVEPRGNVAGAVAADYTTRYTYDPAGNLSQVTDPLGNTSKVTFDASNRVTQAVDPNGNVTRYAYDDADQAVAVAGPTTAAKADLYALTWSIEKSKVEGQGPAFGTVVADNAPMFDALFPISGALFLLGVPATRFAYDANGNAVASADQKNHVRQVRFDELDRPTEQIDPKGRSRVFGYDAEDNMTSMRNASNTPEILLPDSDRAARTTTFTYDALGRMTARQLGTSGPRYTYGYDAKGLLTSAVDPLGTTTYHYDSTSRLDSVTRGSRVFGYGYDDEDRVIRRSYPDGTVIGATYDDSDRMRTLTATRAGTSQTFGFDYDPADRLTRTTYPGATGGVETVDYDRAGRLSKVASTTSGGVDNSYTLVRDAAGNPTRIDTARRAGTGRPVVAQTTAYTYDASHRLTAACYGATVCGSQYAERYDYSYDLVGNRSEQVRTVTGAGFLGLPLVTKSLYAYDDADQLLSESTIGATTALRLFEYDGEGNQTKAGSDTFAYNLDHTLASATVSGQRSTFAYSAAGQRIAATTQLSATQTSTRSWEWDVLGALPMLAVESVTSGGAAAGPAGGVAAGAQRSYAYGVGGVSLGLYTGAGAAGSVYTHDWLGGTSAVVGPAGQGQWTYDYDPFGSPRGTGLVAGGTRLDATAPDNPLQYAGGYNDEANARPTAQNGAAGNYHLRARDYDPGTGRFTSVDPMSPGTGAISVNGYGYAEGRPTAFTDPSGMDINDRDTNNRYVGTEYGNPPPVKDPPTDQNPEDPWTVNPLLAQQEAAQKAVAEAESFTKQLTDEIVSLVMDFIGVTDALKCVRDGDIGSCVSTALQFVPWGKLFKAAKVAIKAVGVGRRLMEGIQRLKAARAALDDIVRKGAELMRTQKARQLEAAKRYAEQKAAQAAAAAQKAREAAAKARQQAARAKAAARSAARSAVDKVKKTLKPGCTNSFAGDTLVLMADGTARPISQVRPGDSVLAGPASDADEGVALAESARQRTAASGKGYDDKGAGDKGDGGHGEVSDPAAAPSWRQAPEPRQVLATITGTGVKHLVDLTLVGAGSGGGSPPSVGPARGNRSTLTATDGHPLWVEGKGWLRAGDLRSGDRLVGPDGIVTATVAAVRSRTETTAVHNLTVADRHTYYITGDEGLTALVHNAKPDQCELLFPGANAEGGVPIADFGVSSPGEAAAVQVQGGLTGCHSCGAMTPGRASGTWTLDHQPVSSLAPDGAPQLGFPHCVTCQSRQGNLAMKLLGGKNPSGWRPTPLGLIVPKPLAGGWTTTASGILIPG